MLQLLRRQECLLLLVFFLQLIGRLPQVVGAVAPWHTNLSLLTLKGLVLLGDWVMLLIGLLRHCLLRLLADLLALVINFILLLRRGGNVSVRLLLGGWIS